MYSAKNPSCNKPNLIIPTCEASLARTRENARLALLAQIGDLACRLYLPASTSLNYLWIGTVQIVNICFFIKCVVVVH